MGTLKNSEHPDEMPQNVAFYLDRTVFLDYNDRLYLYNKIWILIPVTP